MRTDDQLRGVSRGCASDFTLNFSLMDLVLSAVYLSGWGVSFAVSVRETPRPKLRSPLSFGSKVHGSRTAAGN